MTYQPKIIRCRLKTGGKSIEEIREKYKGQGMVYRDFENMQKANEQFDGLTLLLSLWDYDKHESYHMHQWNECDEERVMMAIYYSEQVHPYPRYKNKFKEFKNDWKLGIYDPGCALCFDPADVEELEVICEEVIPPEPVPTFFVNREKNAKKKPRRK